MFSEPNFKSVSHGCLITGSPRGVAPRNSKYGTPLKAGVGLVTGLLRIASPWSYPDRQRRPQPACPVCLPRIWLRDDLETMPMRLKVLEIESALDGSALTAAPPVAPELAKREKKEHGEFESECSGYRGGTGHIPRRLRPRQSTGHYDTCSKAAFACRYDRDTLSSATDPLNDRVASCSPGKNPAMSTCSHRRTEQRAQPMHHRGVVA